VAILAFALLNLYVVSAWDIWWYGGRAMIQSYAVLFFPMGAMVQLMFEKRIWRWVLIPCFVFFSYINLWVVIQAHPGLQDYESTNKDYYMRVIGRWYPDNRDELEKLKDTDELFEGTPKNMQLVYSNDFETDTVLKDPEPAIRGKVSDLVDKNRPYSTNFIFALPQHTKTSWLRVAGSFLFMGREWNNGLMRQLVVEFKNNGETVKSRRIRLDRTIFGRKTKDLYIDVRIPTENFDSVKVFVWNPGSDMYLLIDDIKIWTFTE
jgi:hypothetical protein